MTRVAQYRKATVDNKGHTAVALIHSVFGGVGAEAAEQLRLLDRLVKGRVLDPSNSPWNARTFSTPSTLSTSVRSLHAILSAFRARPYCKRGGA